MTVLYCIVRGFSKRLYTFDPVDLPHLGQEKPPAFRTSSFSKGAVSKVRSLGPPETRSSTLDVTSKARSFSICRVRNLQQIPYHSTMVIRHPQLITGHMTTTGSRRRIAHMADRVE